MHSILVELECVGLNLVGFNDMECVGIGSKDVGFDGGNALYINIFIFCTFISVHFLNVALLLWFMDVFVGFLGNLEDW